MEWLPEPEPGSHVALGFDGSDVDDWSALRAETREGFQFTPRYGPDRLPTIWKPADFPGGRIDRTQVHAAVAEVFDRFKVARFYCDPPRWETDVDEWALEFGEDVVAEWATYRPKPMHEALDRFLTDLQAGRVRHDGCPLTAACVGNARKLAARGVSERYVLGKPSQTQKIDAAMAAVLAHEAAADARAAGWAEVTDSRMFMLG